MIRLIWILSFLGYVFSRHYADNKPLEPNKPITVDANDTEVFLRFLRGVLYKDSFSKLDHAIDLKVGFQDLKGIEEGAICSAPNVKHFRVWISNLENKTITLKKQHFKYCENLESVYLQAITDTEIEQDAFDNFVNLKSLYLFTLDLQNFDKRTFQGLNSLEKLEIHQCQIGPLYDDTFEYVPNLKKLEIEWSGIKRLPETLFQNMNSLEHLNLMGNDISELTWDEFLGLSSLKYLNVKYNRIKYFDTRKIASNMPKLEAIAFQTYPLDCNLKKVIGRELREHLRRNITILHTFTPSWFDRCP